jgi:hypothetical protein
MNISAVGSGYPTNALKYSAKSGATKAILSSACFSVIISRLGYGFFLSPYGASFVSSMPIVADRSFI